MPRSIRLLMIAIGLALTAASAGYYGWASWRVTQMRGWPETSGRIVSSTLRVSQGSRGPDRTVSASNYHPEVRYTYTVDDRAYRGNRLWITGYTGFYRIDEAAAINDAYPPGGAVAVRYNPSDPSDAALRAVSPRWEILFVAAMGIAWIAFGALFMRGRRAHELSHRDRDRRARRTKWLTLASFAAIVFPLLYLMVFA